MRKLVIVRGAPGSGKSTFLREAGLAQWTLSADALRNVISGPMMRTDGTLMTNQEVNRQVFPMMRRIGLDRMNAGETFALDATMAEIADVVAWCEIAEQHFYDVAVVDFSGVPVETMIARDAGRQETEHVGEYRIRAIVDLIDQNPLAGKIGTAKLFDATTTTPADLKSWLAVPVVDLSAYSSVVHVGDIQGCFTVLAGPGAPFEKGLRDDVFHVFVGDLLDRGIENGKLMRWFIDEVSARDNAVLLWGNHEDHLAKWVRGEPAVSEEFEKRTLPQLIRAGVQKAEVEAMLRKTKDILLYDWRGTKVMANHAGLPVVPPRPDLISTRQYSHGTGNWEDPVDEQFDRTDTSGWFQVHGHRNHGFRPVHASERSFNLEDGVEKGGDLRIATLGPDGWSTSTHPNTVFRPLAERIAIERLSSKGQIRDSGRTPKWIMENRTGTRIPDDIMVSMRGHKEVRERSSERFPTVSSFSFSKNVFFNASWDDVTMKARSLFFDQGTHEIVARGYEKFFNVGEREETQPEALAKNFKYPLKIYVKENGFLGNVGYHDQSSKLFVASKSTPDGPFADMFQTLFDGTVSAGIQEAMRRFLRDTESSMTFEVIEPNLDPHPIAYDVPKIFLLDVLKRSVDFEKMEYDKLERVAERFGLEVKAQAAMLPNEKAFLGWLNKVSKDFGAKHHGRHIEGYVIEDADGYMTKVKLPYYAFWKRMRQMAERVALHERKGTPMVWSSELHWKGPRPSQEILDYADAFHVWARDKGAEHIGASNIVSMRNEFVAHVGFDVDTIPEPGLSIGFH